MALRKKCVYCGTENGPFHRDHIIPHSRGGGDDARNCLIACAKCNASKSDLTPSEWYPTGLPDWVYAVEDLLATKYRMDKNRKRKRRRKQPCYPNCFFCEKPLTAEDSFLEIYDQEKGPPFNAEQLTRIYSGVEIPTGDMFYPGSGALIKTWNSWERIVIYSHAECGPDVGYSIPLYRLNEPDWESHLKAKTWCCEKVIQAIVRTRKLVEGANSSH